MTSDGAERARRHLQPKGPAALRFAACFLIFTTGCFLLFWFLDAFANLVVTTLLPGPREAVDFGWVSGLACVGGFAAAVTFEWKLRANVRRAAERAEAGDQIGAVRLLAEATGHGLEWSVSAVQAFLSERPAASPLGVELPEDVWWLADAGEQLRAVTRLRESTGVGIDEAMQRVETYLIKRAKSDAPGTSHKADSEEK